MGSEMCIRDSLKRSKSTLELWRLSGSRALNVPGGNIMARAHRHFVAGQVWHITQRCHNKDFLLRYAIDRRRWMYWLFQARRRYKLCILSTTLSRPTTSIYWCRIVVTIRSLTQFSWSRVVRLRSSTNAKVGAGRFGKTVITQRLCSRTLIYFAAWHISI